MTVHSLAKIHKGKEKHPNFRVFFCCFCIEIKKMKNTSKNLMNSIDNIDDGAIMTLML